MAAGKGKDFLLQIETASDVFTTVGGLRSSGLSGSAEAIDITSIDSAQAKELLDGAGIVAYALSGSGILKDTAPIAALRTAFAAQTLTEFKLVEVGGTWRGFFKITAFELTGEYNGAQQFSLSLESSGAVSFT